MVFPTFFNLIQFNFDYIAQFYSCFQMCLEKSATLLIVGSSYVNIFPFLKDFKDSFCSQQSKIL